MNIPVRLCILAATLLVSPASFSQDTAPGAPRGMAGGMAATRSVARFMALEQSLQQAVEARDRQRVTAMLAPDFEWRTPASADAGLQDDWLAYAFKTASATYQVRDMTVVERDDLALVSFLLDARKPGAAKGAVYFIVDVWRQSSGQLLSRAMSTPAHPPPVRTRPDGRG